MGNTTTVKQLEVSIPSYEGEWKQESHLGHCLLVRNTETGVLAQQYSIPVDGRIDKMQDLWIYEMRRTQTDNIVTVYQVQKEDNQYLCQGQDYLRVKTEHIPYRLSEISNISFNEAIYILKQTLIGYRAIADFCGPIRVTDQMIGFTPQHKVKVWLNQNFAYNLPPEGQEFQFRQSGSLQQRDPTTIALVFEVVEEHMQGGRFPDNFSRAFRQYPMQTFSEAIQFVQQYSSKERIQERQSLVSEITNRSGIYSNINQNYISVKNVQNQRLLRQDPPKQYISQPQTRSQLIVHKNQPQRVIFPSMQNTLYVVPKDARIISNKHQIPQQYQYQPHPLKLIPTLKQQQHIQSIQKRIPTYKNQIPIVQYERPLRKNQIISPNEQKYKYQYSSAINIKSSNLDFRTNINHQNTPIKATNIVPNKQHISQSQLYVIQPQTHHNIANQKQSTTTVHSQSSLISDPFPTTTKPLQQPIIMSKNAFLKKPKNITSDSIPSRYIPQAKLNFLPRK